MMQQIVYNLMENAVKYTPPKGEDHRQPTAGQAGTLCCR